MRCVLTFALHFENDLYLDFKFPPCVESKINMLLQIWLTLCMTGSQCKGKYLSGCVT